MDSIDMAFAALSRRMAQPMAMPERPAVAPRSIASLIARVDAAKQSYQPALNR